MKNGKRTLIWVTSIILLILLLTLYLNSVLKKKAIQQLTENNITQYANVSASLWQRQISLDSLSADSSNATINRLEINNINWLKLARNQNIDLEALTFSLSNVHLPIDEKYQFVTVDKIESDGKNITLHNVDFSTAYEKDEFLSSLKTRKPYIKIHIPELKLYNINLENNHISKISAKEFKSVVSEDLNIPLNQKRKKLLSQILLEIKKDFRIDTLELNNGHVEYSLIDEGSTERGYIEFDDVQITGTNIRNDDLAVKENQSMTLELSSKIENEAPLKIITKHFLGEKNGHYDLYAMLTNMDLSHANDILRCSKGVTTEEGIINSLEINGKFYDQNSSGLVNIDYENLKIDIDRKFSKVFNIIGNAVVHKERVESEPFENIRDPQKSFLIHIWESIMSSVRKIILVV